MSSFKRESDDGASVHGSVPVVEVVEMREVKPPDIQQYRTDGSTGSLDVKMKDRSWFGKQNIQLRAQYDKDEREKKVSKYQSRKKVKPTSVFTTSAVSELPSKVKVESPTKQDTRAQTDQTSGSSIPDNILDEGMQNMSIPLVKNETDNKNESDDITDDKTKSDDTLKMDSSGNPQYSAMTDMEIDEFLEQEHLVGDGGDEESCLQFSPDIDQEGDSYVFDESQQSWSGSLSGDESGGADADNHYDDIMSSEDEADAEMQKDLPSILNCVVKLPKVDSSLLDGRFEWNKKGDVWCLSSSDENPGEESATAAGLKSEPSTSYQQKGRVVQKPVKLPVSKNTPSPRSITISKNVERSPSSESGKSKGSVISPVQSPCSFNSSLKTPPQQHRPSSGSAPVTKLTGVTVPSSKLSLQVTVSKSSNTTKVEEKSPGVSSPSHSVQRTTVLTHSASQADNNGLNNRTQMLISDFPTSTSDTNSYQSPTVGRYSHSSLSGELGYSLMEREILPSIRTAGHLGLSSHSETDWTVEEVAEINADVGDEDMDVLSLYEYDTFLESEDEVEERNHGAAMSRSSIVKHQKSLQLTAKQNLSISVSDHSERRVSRPNSKERPEVEHDNEGGPQKDRNDSENSMKPDHKKKERERPSNRTNVGAKEPPKENDDHSFQKPKLPALKTQAKSNKNQPKSSQRPSKNSLLGRPENLPQRGLQKGKQDKPHQSTWGGHRASKQALRDPQSTQTVSFEKVQLHCLEETQKELEVELKFFMEKKSILEATETVGKIHRHESMKIDRGLVLNLLHVFIREGAVPQLMKIFTFVCNQGLFNTEVCNAYIRLGCAEGSRYDRQLKNIFQYLRRHSIQPAGDCVISLLRHYSEHKGDPVMFWLMLMYFETFPGFTIPMPLLEQSILKVLQHKDHNALSRFSMWVLTTKTESALKQLDLGLVGKMTVSMLPAALSRLRKIIADTQEESTTETEKTDLPIPEETVLVLPENLSDQDYQLSLHHIQDCGSLRDFERLAQTFWRLCRFKGFNRPLLKDYTKVLVQEAVVTSVDIFLHKLYDTFQQVDPQGTPPELDRLALAQLAALLLEDVFFRHHTEVTLSLFDAITRCPLVEKKQLINRRDVGYKMISVFLSCQQPLKALDLLKDIRLRKNDEQGVRIVKELMQKLVAEKDIPSAFTALNITASREALEIGSLSTQLMWHALNVGNVKVALDLMDLGQKQPTPVSFPVALLRALLVACHQSGFTDKSSSLFEQLKLQRVYNLEPLGSYPCDFQLSTMLTPAEVNLCLMDRLKEIHHRLRTTVGPKDKDLDIQIVGEHDPQLLALPFLALAPRSVEQAADVVILELNDISPLLRGTFNKQIKLVVVDCVSLGMYLKRFDSADLDPGFGWEKQASQSLPSSVQRPTAPLPHQSDHAIGRQLPKPASVAYSYHQPRGSVRSQLPVPSSTVPLPPQSVSAVGGLLSLPPSVSQQSAVAVKRQMSVPSNPRSPPQQPGRPMKRQLSAPPNKPSTFKKPLLPTPPIPPKLQVAVAPTTSSSEPPPKKAKISSPNKPIVGGRQPLKKNQQVHRSPPLPIYNRQLQQSMRGQQSPRGRGKPQQGNMYKYKKWSPVKSSKLSGKQSPQPTRDTRRLPIELPCSIDQGLQQTTQSIVQSLQQFPQHTGALYSDRLPGVTGKFPPPSTQSSDHLPPFMESVMPQFTEEARFSGPSHSNPSRSSGHFLLPSAESRDHLPPRTSESIGRSLPQFTEDVHFSGPLYNDHSRSSGHFPLPSTESRDHLPPLLAENIGQSLPRFTEGTHLSRRRYNDHLGSSEHFPLQSTESRDHLPELAPFHHLPSQSKQRSQWSPPPPAQGAEQLRFDRATRESLHARFDDDCPPHQLLPARFDEGYHPPNRQPLDTVSQGVSRQSQPLSSLQNDPIPVITDQIRVRSSLLEEATEALGFPDRFSRPLRLPSPGVELVHSGGRLLPNDHDRWAGQSGRTPPFTDPRQWPDSFRQPRDFRER